MALDEIFDKVDFYIFMSNLQNRHWKNVLVKKNSKVGVVLPNDSKQTRLDATVST